MAEPVTAADIGIIVLAAGSSQRFAGDKRAAALPGGKTILQATLDSIPPSLGKRILVLRPNDHELAERHSEYWNICIAADANLGMGHSLAAAVKNADHWRGALITLADMPLIRPETYSCLQEALTRHPIVTPVYGKRRGNPVGFQQQYFPEIMSLQGDRGARSLLKKHREHCHAVPVDDPGILMDIDTPDILQKLADSPSSDN